MKAHHHHTHKHITQNKGRKTTHYISIGGDDGDDGGGDGDEAGENTVGQAGEDGGGVVDDDI